jgi:hypothetical protein
MTSWRRMKWDDKLLAIFMGLALAASLFESYPLFSVFIVFVGLGSWWGFGRRTTCGIGTKNTDSCGNIARGALRGCHLPHHGRMKRRHLWERRHLLRPATPTPPDARLRELRPETSNSYAPRASQYTLRPSSFSLEIVSLVMTTIGTVAGVAQVVLILLDK